MLELGDWGSTWGVWRMCRDDDFDTGIFINQEVSKATVKKKKKNV